VSLTIFKNDDRDFQLMQTSWSQELNPLLRNPVSSGRILKFVTLETGNNVVNHGLGRKLQGWFIVRQRATGSFYDTQDQNERPQLTLNLVSSATVTVDIFVF
jgi:hypothetical protein